MVVVVRLCDRLRCVLGSSIVGVVELVVKKTGSVAEVTAIEMARAVGIGELRFRRALRKAKPKLDWHEHDTNWTVEEGSPEHEDMIRVLRTLICT